MNGRDVFKKWAPNDNKWTPWVRPVAFVAINEGDYLYEYSNLVIPKINYCDSLDKETAIFIDLPSYEGVNVSLAFAQLGYRPIPLYNGPSEPSKAMSTVNNHAIENALIWGGFVLENIKLKKDAPPCFMLDSNRLHRLKMNNSIFDNSWDIYPQDIPSPKYFIENGIKTILIYSEQFNKDLQKVLYKHQKKGIKILFTNGYEMPREYIIKIKN